jgi:hypothetical protein
MQQTITWKESQWKKYLLDLNFLRLLWIELDVYYYTVCQGFGHYYIGFSTGIYKKLHWADFFYVCKPDSLAAQFQTLLQTSLSTILLHQQKPSHFEESVMCKAVFVLIMCFLRLTFLITKLPKKKNSQKFSHYLKFGLNYDFILLPF